jgi:cytochrome c2
LSPPLLAQQSGKWAGTPQEEFANSDLMMKYQCVTCHTVMDGGGTVGPILNQVGNRREKEWLERWIMDPQEIKPGTKMPKFNFTDEEHGQVVDFLSNLSHELETDKILATPHDSLESQGNHYSKTTIVKPVIDWVGRVGLSGLI